MGLDSEERDLPKWRLDGEKILFDRCVWCGRSSELSASHLFPKSLGARFAPVISCQKCNNCLGGKYEGKATRNAFLAAARAKLKLCDRRTAYRFGKKVDVASGVEMHHTKGGKCRPVKKIDGTRIIGLPDEMKEMTLNQFAKEDPEFPVAQLAAFYEDPSRDRFEWGGEVITHERYEGGEGEIRIEGMTRDPDPFLVFKIAYEFAAFFWMCSKPEYWSCLTGFATIRNTDSNDRIELAEGIYNRVVSNTSVGFRQYRCLEDIPFKEFHSAAFRVSGDLRLYIDIWFFGAIRSMFLVGDVDVLDDWLAEVLDQALIFPIDGSDVYAKKWPNVRYANHSQWGDVVIDDRARQLQQSGLYP